MTSLAVSPCGWLLLSGGRDKWSWSGPQDKQEGTGAQAELQHAMPCRASPASSFPASHRNALCSSLASGTSAPSGVGRPCLEGSGGAGGAPQGRRASRAASREQRGVDQAAEAEKRRTLRLSVRARAEIEAFRNSLMLFRGVSLTPIGRALATAGSKGDTADLGFVERELCPLHGHCPGRGGSGGGRVGGCRKHADRAPGPSAVARPRSDGLNRGSKAAGLQPRDSRRFAPRADEPLLLV